MSILNVFKKADVYQKLLDYGLFSESLSKIFTSESYGKWIRRNNPTDFIKEPFSTVVYHLTRNNNAPRILEVPHPIAYFRLCNEIRKYWFQIATKIGEVNDYEEKSMIIPKPNNLNQRLFSMLSYNSNKEEKFLMLDKSFNAKYYVHADIANCYPSIYSHSIPWALVGHQIAKNTSKDKTKWYNKLDFAIRSMQRNETVGIAIGPDTSSLISELVLTRIDKELMAYKYLRYIDDYKGYCYSKEEAEEFLRTLSKALEKYHLRLNPKKTEIVELPKTLDQDWVRNLKVYSSKFLNKNRLTKKDINNLSDFLDLSIKLAKENPGDSPIKYAVKILSKKEYADNDILIFLIMYLSRICFIYPYFIDVFDEVLKNNHPDTEIKKLLKNEISNIVNEHVRYSRSDVSLWGIRFAIKYKFNLVNYINISNFLIKDRDCLPTLMCYEYAKAKKLSIKKYIDIIEDIIDDKNEDEWWIYIYTVYYDNPTKPVFKKIKYKGFYEKMRKGKVVFIQN